MKKIKVENKPELVSNYKGSQKTFDLVAAQIKDRYGSKEVDKYDPYLNCLSFKCWLGQGYRVKRGEKAIKSVTFIEKKEPDGTVKKYLRQICLFYYLQVEKIK